MFIVKNGLLYCNLIKTKKRLTFDILSQDDRLTFNGADEDDYYMFIASNGYQIISRSRMDIQTERIWLLGGTNDESSIRSGTMIFSSDDKRDKAFDKFQTALTEWGDNFINTDGYNNKLSDYVKQNGI